MFNPSRRVVVITALAALVVCIGFFGMRVMIGAWSGMGLSGETLAHLARNRPQLDGWIRDGHIVVRRTGNDSPMSATATLGLIDQLSEVDAANDLARQRQFEQRYEVVATGEPAMRVILSGGILGLLVQLVLTWALGWGVLLGATMLVLKLRPPAAASAPPAAPPTD